MSRSYVGLHANASPGPADYTSTTMGSLAQYWLSSQGYIDECIEHVEYTTPVDTCDSEEDMLVDVQAFPLLIKRVDPHETNGEYMSQRIVFQQKNK